MVFATDSLDAEVTLLHPVQAVKAQRTFLTFPDAGERNWMKAPGQQRSFFSTLRVSQYCGRCAWKLFSNPTRHDAPISRCRSTGRNRHLLLTEGFPTANAVPFYGLFRIAGKFFSD